MSEKIISTTIEILGKIYPVRCPESELTNLLEAAGFLNAQMLEVRDSGKAINLERIAIITALNITHQFLQLEKNNQDLLQKVNQKMGALHEKLANAVGKSVQTDLLYASE